MLLFTTHNYFVFTRKEIWFYNGEPVKEGTYNVYAAAKKISNENNKFQEKYKTSVIHLSKLEEELFKAIHATYRYDIRSAEKKNILHKTILNPKKEDCIELVKSYNFFAKSKNMPTMSLRRILALQKTSSIYITKALQDEKEISTHVYIFDENIISLASSFHHIDFTDGKIRSEANKYLHWKDILLFKSIGFQQYDFGGVNEKKHPGISKFKLSFGGEPVENYRFIKTSTFIFYLITILKKMKIT
jgi:lipid II:glycine glycyltransferase (peptidoglycan interpeptide bridge formation enzyme)